ncbi:aldehyde ferredoxin oxidoreductase N-terminal domain-containing protein [Escherichia coli]
MTYFYFYQRKFSCRCPYGWLFAAQMGLAGYDVIIIEGKAKSPVWLKIKDDEVSLEKAEFLWGKGTRATTEEIRRLTSPETCVAAIGQAGENLVPLLAC